MCNFITAVLPASADSPAFRALVERSGLAFVRLSNQHIVSQLRPGEAYYHATQAHCDCGTALGSSPGGVSHQREIRKLREKGWGEAKIQKWVSAKGTESRRRKGCGELSCDAWLAFLDAALALPRVPYVGLMQHFYKRSTDDEDFRIERREEHDIDALRHGAFAWQEDVLYELRATKL